MPAFAQRVTADFRSVSMSKALLIVERQSKRCRINFIYEDLQDFTITQKITNRSVADALRLIAGFYPVRITQRGNVFTVECIQREAYKVTGRILDQSGNPLSCASVELLSLRDSMLLNSGISNSNGDVVIPCAMSRVLAKVSCLGYNTVYQQCTNGRLGDIKMDVSVTALPKVTVKAPRTAVRVANGVLTYSIASLLQDMPSTNAYEALTRIPGVKSEIDGLSFAATHANLVVNGKPTTLSEDQIIDWLKKMPAELLSSVEIMASPPARYHTQGMTINVITKDVVGTNQLMGQMQATSRQSKYGTRQGTANLIYSNRILAIDAQYSCIDGKQYSEAKHYAEHPHAVGVMRYDDVVHNVTDILKHEARLGADCAFAPRHRLGAVYTGAWLQNAATNLTLGTLPTTQQGEATCSIHNVDVNYQLPIGLQLNASYMSYKNPRAHVLGDNMQDVAYSLSTNSNQRIHKWIATADYEHKLSRVMQASCGIKLQLTDNISHQSTYDGMGMEIPEGSIRVNYQERILSPYVEVSGAVGSRLTMAGSLSVEHYKTPRRHACRVFPTFRASWKTNARNQLNLSLGSGATYPSYWSTLSSVYFASAYKEIWGNPDLRPSSHYELNIGWQLQQKYSLMFFARFNPDYFAQQPYQARDTMAVVLQEHNFDYSATVGVQASAKLNVSKWLAGNLTLVGYYRRDKYSRFFDPSFDRGRFTSSMNATISARLLPAHNLRLDINPRLESQAIQGVYDIASMFEINAQLCWTSDSKWWNLILAGDNLTNNALTAKSVCGNQYYRADTNLNYRSVSLTAVLKLGGYKPREHKAVDVSRMGYL